MPPAIETDYTDDVQRRWSQKIHGLDGYVIVTPEYNHGYPGHLKNAIDHVHLGWWYKPVAFVSYGGTACGARAVEQLRNVAVEVRMVPVRSEVNIRLIGLERDGDGPKDPLYSKMATGMIRSAPVVGARGEARARRGDAAGVLSRGRTRSAPHPMACSTRCRPPF